jgi:alpha-1,4-digalacturonate transport system permease protein
MPSRRRSFYIPYLFLAPNLLVFVIFIIIPAIYNFYLSLFKTSFDKPPEFVGLDNFIYLFQRDDFFWRALSNLIIFVIGDVGLILILSLGIALLLNEDIRWRGFFRSVFFYPVLLSPVVVALIWRWFLNTQYGLLNNLLRAVGIPPQPWLLRPDLAMLWVILVHVWATVGFFALILLAGLQAIPPVLYEAALVDGATRWRSFWHITLPLLAPTIFVVFILSMIRSFEVFDHIYALTGGGPGTATMMIVQYIYRTGFEMNQFGLASAASLVLFIIIFSLTLLQYWLGRLGEAV